VDSAQNFLIKVAFIAAMFLLAMLIAYMSH